MKTKDLRKQTEAKLKERFGKARQELADLRLGVKIGEEQDYSQINKKQKEVARIVTILREGSFATEEAKAEKAEKKSEKKETKTKKTTKKTETKK